MIKRKMHGGQEMATLFLSSSYSHGFSVVVIFFYFVWSHPLLSVNAEKGINCIIGAVKMTSGISAGW